MTPQVVLEERGYQVIAAANRADALRLAACHQGEIHLVVTDAVMPGMKGRDLIVSLQAVRPAVRALLMSGYDSPGPRPAAGNSDFAFLQKPFTPERLAQAVRDCIEAR